MDQRYIYNNDLKVWETTNPKDCHYSYEKDVEKKIFRIIKEAKDLSCASDELPSYIDDWPTEYHLSKKRHNLLRPFYFGIDDEILDIGCGCGTITVQLGETGAKVTAVDGSIRRAAITAERCRNLSNVTVYCDNITEFTTGGKYHYVLMIGTLEWVPSFFSGNNPIQEMLKIAMNHLSDDGILILAIENQLGLKYFNGHIEDHLEIPFYGINDLYSSRSPITFGKEELSSLLKSVGFNRLDFYYPFPDYKLPSTIISQNGLNNKNVNIGDLLSNSSIGYDYRIFHEKLAMQVLARNGLVTDLSNSFLLFAGKNPESTKFPRPNWLAKVYSVVRRSYTSTETTFELKNGEIVVNKGRIFKNVIEEKKDAGTDAQFYQVIKNTNYIVGKLYVTELNRILLRQGGFDEIVLWAKPWIELLMQNAISNDPKEKTDTLFLPGNYIDCTPFNLIINDKKELLYFDDEWQSKVPIPMLWVIVRGIVSSLDVCDTSYNNMTYQQFIDVFLSKFDLKIDTILYEEINELEKLLTEYCFGPKNVYDKSDYLTKLRRPFGNSSIDNQLLAAKQQLTERDQQLTERDKQLTERDKQLTERDKQLTERDQQLAERDKQLVEQDYYIHSLLNSLSWRFTAPLRQVSQKMRDFKTHKH